MTAQTKSEAAEPPARRMLGRYELLAEIGSGAMGVVYLGRLQCGGGFERLFAIKVVHKHLAQKPKIIEMLVNEARLAAQIQHPNVVSTVDAEFSEHGQNFVVMDYVDGFTLCELLDHPKLDAIRRVRLGLRILLDAMAGLDAAHRLCNPADGTPLQIVHRDVSPSNVLVNLAGAGLIADFGIARAAAFSVSTLPGVLKGTPCYMAPEQASGSDDLDARADVFALGAVLWEVLTGEQLFYSPIGIGGVLDRVLTDKIEAPSCRNSRLPTAVDVVCLKALRRELGERYPSVRELAEELEHVGRECDLIASTHELAEALAQLFADSIERRRATLTQVLDHKRESNPPPALAAASAPAAVAAAAEVAPAAAPAEAASEPPAELAPKRDDGSAEQAIAALAATQLPELESGRGSGEGFDSELAALLRQPKRRWPLAALAACGALALAALLLEAPRTQHVGSANAALPAARAAAPIEPAKVIPTDTTAITAAVAAPAPAPAALPNPAALALIVDPELGEDSTLAGAALPTSPPSRRLRAARNAEPAPRVRARASGAAAAPAGEALFANRDRSATRAAVLEKNPYLLQR